MDTELIIALVSVGVISHFIFGSIVGHLKLKAYLNITPTNDFPILKRIFRRLLFPLSSEMEIWVDKIGCDEIKGYVGPLNIDAYPTLIGPIDKKWLEFKTDSGFSSSCHYSILRSQAVDISQKKALAGKYLIFSSLIGFLQLIPLTVGILTNIAFGIGGIASLIVKMTSAIYSIPVVSSSNEPDKLEGFRNFRDQQVAAQKERLEELKRKTETSIVAMNKLIFDWQSKIKEFENGVTGINTKRFKSLVEKISFFLAEKRDDLEKITIAINGLNKKRLELDNFIGTLELYQRTAELIPDMNGEGRSITAQIEENMAGAIAAVEFIKKFYDLELEIGARLELAPEVLAQQVAEGLERTDPIEIEGNKISQ